MKRMVEDVGFAVTRMRVRGDRVPTDAERNVKTSAETRQAFASGVMPRLPRGNDASDPASWILF